VVEYIFSILSAPGRHLAILPFGKSLIVDMKSTPKTKERISGLENSKYYQNGILKVPEREIFCMVLLTTKLLGAFIRTSWKLNLKSFTLYIDKYC